jgi:cytochrome c-type biogenesis protein
VEKVMGGLLVITGVLFITGGMATVSYWLLETFPALSNIG